MPFEPGSAWPTVSIARKAGSSSQRRPSTISRYSHPAVPPPKLVQPSRRNARKIAQRLGGWPILAPAEVSRDSVMSCLYRREAPHPNPLPAGGERETGGVILEPNLGPSWRAGSTAFPRPVYGERDRVRGRMRIALYVLLRYQATNKARLTREVRRRWRILRRVSPTGAASSGQRFGAGDRCRLWPRRWLPEATAASCGWRSFS